MYVLHGSLGSPYVARVVLAARHKGLDLKPQMPADLKSAAYRAINPFAKMPSLEHNGCAVIESDVIVEYLEDSAPGPSVLPGGAADRARARGISRAMDLYVGTEVSTLFRQMDPATRDPAVVEACKARLAEALAGIDALVVGPWAAGAFSLADCTLLPWMVILHKTVVPVLGVPDPVTTHGNLARWWETTMGEPVTRDFHREYAEAFDALLARLRGG
ncbi:MAG: glutathione S-transferase family protein [Steroidobacteraceae bacterium]